jgi:hypothetical protein
MLEAIPTDIFATNFRLHEQNKLLGEVDTSVWREKARLELEEGTYELYRDGKFRGDFLLERNGNVVARATKPSAFQNKFEVELPNHSLVLRRLSLWSRRFGLFEGQKQLGSIYPIGLFTRRANIDLPADWPVAQRIFLFWLAFLMWRRQNQAAAS